MLKWAAAVFGTLVIAFAAHAQPAEPAHGSVCLRPNDIDHTHTVDPRTILFYMRDGKIWRNTLQDACPGLMFNGFAYVVHGDEVCSNMQTIRVIDDGEMCFLGTFTPYTPPPKAAAP